MKFIQAYVPIIKQVDSVEQSFYEDIRAETVQS